AQNKENFKNASFLKKMVYLIPLEREKMITKKLVAKNLKRALELESCADKQAKSFDKLKSWKRVQKKWETLSPEVLDAFQNEKRMKWKEKLEGLKFEQIKACFNLALKVI